jgi:hypothetical protein
VAVKVRGQLGVYQSAQLSQGETSGRSTSPQMESETLQVIGARL